MRRSAFLFGSALALAILLPAGFSSAQDPPSAAPVGEDYGQPRLPRDVYERVVIPNEAPATPAPVPQATARAHVPPGDAPAADPPPRCRGMGCPPTELSVAQQLLSQGPDTSEIYAPFESRAHQFAVVGFVKSGWPLSIEYEAEPGTVTVLRVKLYHQRKILIFPIPFFEVAFQANLDALDSETQSSNPWHRTVKISAVHLSREADAAADEGLHVARYEVRSYRIVDGGARQRAPLKVFGMTVGPDVVGSVTLSADRFAGEGRQIPATDTPPTIYPFHYRVQKNYDLLKERIERFDDNLLDYRVVRIIGGGHSASQDQGFQVNWRLRRNLRPGRYRASVLGWWRCQAGVTLTNGVLSCPNDPNWAITSSGDLNLHY